MVPSSARTGPSPGSGWRLRRAPRPGVAALLEWARIAPDAVDLETISFALAPRLNAAGRVGEALEAARLLLARRPGRGAVHADALEAANLTRRDLMKTAVAEARAAVGDGRATGRPSSTARGRSGSSASWPPVWSRTVAGRRSSVPSSAMSSGPRAGATGRSTSAPPSSVRRPLHPVWRPRRRGRVRARRPSAGTPSASGSCGSLAETAPPDPRVSIAIDLVVPAIDVDYALHRELAGLAPCGPGNPDPLVAVLGLTVTRVRAATGGHTQLTLRRDRDVLDGIAFGRADLAEVVREGDRLDVVARLISRRFGGFEFAPARDPRRRATSGQPRPDGGAPAPNARPQPVLAGTCAVTRSAAPGRGAGLPIDLGAAAAGSPRACRSRVSWSSRSSR